MLADFFEGIADVLIASLPTGRPRVWKIIAMVVLVAIAIVSILGVAIGA